MKEQSNQRGGPTTFVTVHGAWVGSWAWLRVADRLIAKGHRVYTPTLSGLGERSHLAQCGINLTTHVNDIVNEITWKDLDQVVLVGHSYGGFVITGVAEKIRERIASIVYLEAFIPTDGQAFAPSLDATKELTVPPPSSEGDYLSESDRAWVAEKVTPQPAATFAEKLRVTGAYQQIPRKTFIRATGWDGPFDETVKTLRADPSWTVHEIACGHDVPMDKPDELVAILEESI
ncbi:MAG TPA: alpha/beta hydrolase [Nitrospira sp.]|nr:alpha/beta hydrolase [Nitrospira sp.]